jgi:hypothetical protein
MRKPSLLETKAPRGAHPFLSAGLLLTLTGCASYSAKPLETRQEASSIIEQREAEGLFVAVKDVSNPRDSLQYFDRDLLEYGYVPVLLLLELDRNSQCVFDVRREDIQLCLRDGRRLTSVDPHAVAEKVSFSHFRSAMGFLLIFPGFFLASSVNNANEELEIDYQLKTMKSIRINPNMRSFRAVMFFQVPRDHQETFTMEDAFVEIKIFKQGQGGAMGKCLEFPVHFGK